MEALKWLRACFLQGQGMLRALNHLLLTHSDAFDLIYKCDVKDDFIVTETKALHTKNYLDQGA